jgi:hypothetical protein
MAFYLLNMCKKYSARGREGRSGGRCRRSPLGICETTPQTCSSERKEPRGLQGRSTDLDSMSMASGSALAVLRAYAPAQTNRPPQASNKTRGAGPSEDWLQEHRFGGMPLSPALERCASLGGVSACWLLVRDDTDLPVPLHVRLFHLGQFRDPLLAQMTHEFLLRH